MNRLALHGVFFVLCHCLIGQDFQRISPQATQGTILIDRDTDLTNLKEQALYAYRNIDNDDINTVRAVQLLFEAFRDELKKKKHQLVIKKSISRDSILIKLADGADTTELLRITPTTGNLIQDISRLINSIGSDFKKDIENNIKRSAWNKPTRDKALEIIEEDLNSLAFPLLNQENKKPGKRKQGTLPVNFRAPKTELTKLSGKLALSAFQQREKNEKRLLSKLDDLERSINNTKFVSKKRYLQKDSLFTFTRKEIKEDYANARSTIIGFLSAYDQLISGIKADKSDFREERKEVLEKVKKYSKVALNSYEIWKEFLNEEKSNDKKIDLEQLVKVVIRQLSALDDIVDIPEVERIEAVSEILFGLKRSLNNVKVLADSVKNDTLQVYVVAATDTLVHLNALEDSTAFTAMRLILKNLYDYLQQDLINRLGSDHPSVSHFAKIYADLENAFDNFYSNNRENNDSYALSALLNERIVYLIHDFQEIREVAGDIDKNISSHAGLNTTLEAISDSLNNLNLLTQIGQTLEGEVRKVIEEARAEIERRTMNNSNVEIARRELAKLREARQGQLQLFLKKYIIETMQTIIIEYLEKQMKEALKDPKRFAWLNNLTISDSSEFSTTIVYNLVLRKNWAIELSANLFYNPSTNFQGSEEDLGDTVTNRFAKRIIVGLSPKFALNDRWEWGFNGAISSNFTSNFRFNGTGSSPDFYIGTYTAFPVWPKFNAIERLRLFFEFERQVIVDTSTDNVQPAELESLQPGDFEGVQKFLNSGLELKFGPTFLFDGIFVVVKNEYDKKNWGVAAGLTFPIVK